jgi:chromosome segregation ATPase
MSTSPDKLQAALSDLHSELDALNELDESTRERLRATIAEIQTVLKRRASADRATAKPQPQDQSLAARLNDATRELESTHPALATNLGGVIHALAQMGI